MSKLFVVLFLAFAAAFPTDPLKLRKINQLKEKAEEAMLADKFQEAIAYYHILTDSFNVSEPSIELNIAHAQFQLKQIKEAGAEYADVARATSPTLASIALLQSGNLRTADQEKLEEAAELYKSALRKNPANEEARYNYELVKKKLKQQQEQQEQDSDENQDEQEKEEQKKKEEQDKKDQDKSEQEGENEDKEKQDEEGDPSDEQNKKEGEPEEGEPDDQNPQQSEDQKKQQEQQQRQQQVKQRMKEIKLSEDRAKMMLEALKNNEIQYYQQMKRKSDKRNTNGKDW
jgi:hypothetical protein